MDWTHVSINDCRTPSVLVLTFTDLPDPLDFRSVCCRIPQLFDSAIKIVYDKTRIDEQTTPSLFIQDAITSTWTNLTSFNPSDSPSCERVDILIQVCDQIAPNHRALLFYYDRLKVNEFTLFQIAGLLFPSIDSKMHPLYNPNLPIKLDWSSLFRPLSFTDALSQWTGLVETLSNSLYQRVDPNILSQDTNYNNNSVHYRWTKMMTLQDLQFWCACLKCTLQECILFWLSNALYKFGKQERRTNLSRLFFLIESPSLYLDLQQSLDSVDTDIVREEMISQSPSLLQVEFKRMDTFAEHIAEIRYRLQHAFENRNIRAMSSYLNPRLDCTTMYRHVNTPLQLPGIADHVRKVLCFSLDKEEQTRVPLHITSVAHDSYVSLCLSSNQMSSESIDAFVKVLQAQIQETGDFFANAMRSTVQ